MALTSSRQCGVGVRLRALRNCSQQIADLYEEAAGSGRPLDRVLAIPRAAFITQTAARHSHWSLQPQIQLSLSAPLQAVRERGLDREHTLMVRERTHTSNTDRLVERLTTRLERVDALRETVRETVERTTPAAQHAEAAPPMTHWPVSAPSRAVARVVKHNPSTTSRPPQVETTHEDVHRPAEFQRPASPSSLRREPPAPALNVDQLAERVVRVIDRRLTATRERFGRF